MRSADSGEKLEKLIGGLEKKRKKFLLLKGLAVTALVCLAVLSVVLLLSIPYSGHLYYSFLKIALLVILAYCIFRFMYLPIFKHKYRREIFMELERNSGGLGEDTLNAVELNSASGEIDSGTSRDLASAHISYVTERLESLDRRSIFPLAKLKKFALPVAGTAIVVAIAVYFAPRGFLTYILSAQITPSYDAPALELADIEITLNYPGYTKLPRKTLRNGTGDIDALKGTKVTFEAKPLWRFKSGKLITNSGASYPVTMKDGVITSEFTVLGNGGYRIAEAVGGNKTRQFRITAAGDKKPVINISSPGGSEIESGPDGRIEIFYEAKDDYGLTEFRLASEGQAGKTEKLIGKAKGSPTTYNEHYTLDVGGLNFGDGDMLKLRVEALDNDSVSGPNVGTSNAITVKLKDAAKRHRDVMDYAGQLMEQMIDTLGDEIEVSGAGRVNAPGGDSDTVTDRQDTTSLSSINIDEMLNTQQKLTEKIEGTSDTLKKVLDIMKDDNKSDYTYFAGLSNMDVRIDDLLDDRRGILDNFASVDVPRVGRLMKREISEFEEDVLFLDSMIKSERLRDSLLSGRELMKRYSELSRMLSKLDQTGDPALKAEIQKKLDQLSDLMAQLTKKLSAMSGDIQEGFLNLDAFKSIDMQKNLDEISKLLQEGNIDKAMQKLASLQNSLQGMIASLESGYQSYAASAFSQDMSKLNQLLARIDGLEREESKLRNNTLGLKESLLKNPGTGSNNLRKFIDQEKKKVEEIRKNLSQANAKITKEGESETSPEGTYLLDSLIQKTEELRNWLDSMELKEAQKNAKNVEETSKGLIDLGNAGVGNLKNGRQEIQNSHQIAGQVARDLERFIGSGKETPGSSGMAKRQDEIKEQTGALAGDLEKTRKEMLMTPGIGDDLGDAQNHMGRASDNLNGNEISKAISSQDDAVKSLKQAKEKAEDMLQKMQASAQGNGSSVPMVLGQRQNQAGTQGVDTGYVEIPEAPENEIGKAFKEQILQAMKGGSPEGYGELNKQYYDRIIK
jgi:soluble cytochrome b562